MSFQDVLPADVIAMLGGALTPVEPARGRRDELRQQILDRAGARVAQRGAALRPPGFVTVLTDEGCWQSYAPGVEVKACYESDAFAAFMLRLAPGACLAAQHHPAEQYFLVVSGDVQVGGRAGQVGDFFLSAAGATLGEIRSRGGCMLAYPRAEHPDCDNALKGDALAGFTQNLRAIEPPAHRRALLRARILAAVRLGQPLAPPTNLITVQSDQGHWQPVLAGIEMKLLHDHGKDQSILLRLQAGAKLPAHHHHQDEDCIVLQGTVLLGDIEAEAGTFHLALDGSDHGIVSTTTGCVLYLRTNLDRALA